MPDFGAPAVNNDPQQGLKSLAALMGLQQQKQAIESPALQRLGEIKPIGQAVIVGGAVAWMGPQPRRLMRDAIHRKRVEPDFFFHAR